MASSAFYSYLYHLFRPIKTFCISCQMIGHAGQILKKEEATHRPAYKRQISRYMHARRAYSIYSSNGVHITTRKSQFCVVSPISNWLHHVVIPVSKVGLYQNGNLTKIGFFSEKLWQRSFNIPIRYLNIHSFISSFVPLALSFGFKKRISSGKSKTTK